MAVSTTANSKPEHSAAYQRGAPTAGPRDRATQCAPSAWRIRRGSTVRQPALPQWNVADQEWQASIRRAPGQRAGCRCWPRCPANLDHECTSAARVHLGSLDRVSKVVRVGVYLATSGDFYNQPIVADAASELLLDVFGEGKTSVRSGFGIASLPLGPTGHARGDVRSQ